MALVVQGLDGRDYGKLWLYYSQVTLAPLPSGAVRGDLFKVRPVARLPPSMAVSPAWLAVYVAVGLL